MVLLHRLVLVVLGYQSFPDSQQGERVKFDIYGAQCYEIKIEKLQYCSKVSYYLLYCFSHDENLWLEIRLSRDKSFVLQEPVKNIFWNKLQAVSLQENN